MRRGAPPRTIDYLVHEELGHALASVCFSSPSFHHAIISGFSRATLEKLAGRRFDKDSAVGALSRATTAVHHANQPAAPTRTKRPR